ncbi:hypothetical protein PRUPE_8G111000 [Prunus persica]|uniref:Uncharacterized protein n=1 Tax=Prunus persica TaxID=3760 RepID=A0A251MWB0_PRUPE|nr:hypothetical protein PRUPE_8G111000 [Prunus persica]
MFTRCHQSTKRSISKRTVASESLEESKSL